MKILIGAACVAIIAAVAYYFVSEFKRHEAEQQMKADQLARQAQRLADECALVFADVALRDKGRSMLRHTLANIYSAERACLKLGMKP